MPDTACHTMPTPCNAPSKVLCKVGAFVRKLEKLLVNVPCVNASNAWSIRTTRRPVLDTRSPSRPRIISYRTRRSGFIPTLLSPYLSTSSAYACTTVTWDHTEKVAMCILKGSSESLLPCDRHQHLLEPPQAAKLTGWTSSIERYASPYHSEKGISVGLAELQYIYPYGQMVQPVPDVRSDNPRIT